MSDPPDYQPETGERECEEYAGFGSLQRPESARRLVYPVAEDVLVGEAVVVEFTVEGEAAADDGVGGVRSVRAGVALADDPGVTDSRRTERWAGERVYRRDEMVAGAPEQQPREQVRAEAASPGPWPLLAVALAIAPPSVEPTGPASRGPCFCAPSPATFQAFTPRTRCRRPTMSAGVPAAPCTWSEL